MPQSYGSHECTWVGYVEVCGLDTNAVYQKLDAFVTQNMGGVAVPEDTLVRQIVHHSCVPIEGVLFGPCCQRRLLQRRMQPRPVDHAFVRFLGRPGGRVGSRRV